MESSRPKLLLLCFLFLASAVSTAAHIAEYDEYWEKKAELARTQSQAAYNPNPESVASTFNADVHKYNNFNEIFHLND